MVSLANKMLGDLPPYQTVWIAMWRGRRTMSNMVKWLTLNRFVLFLSQKSPCAGMCFSCCHGTLLPSNTSLAHCRFCGIQINELIKKIKHECECTHLYRHISINNKISMHLLIHISLKYYAHLWSGKSMGMTHKSVFKPVLNDGKLMALHAVAHKPSKLWHGITTPSPSIFGVRRKLAGQR